MMEDRSFNAVQPVSSGERIQVLDSLRGIAVLGILLMNIPGFSMPRVAFYNPILIDFTGWNFYSWYGVQWFLEGSMRGIFSILFGAGILLFISRAEKRTTGMQPADYFFRRQLWLLAFGLFHAYILLWFWDILFHYAILGMFLFVFRNMSARNLLLAAAVCVVLQAARNNVDFYRDKAIVSRGEAISSIDTTRTALSPLQKDQLAQYTSFVASSTNEAKKKVIEKNMREVQTSYSTLYDNHSAASFATETTALFTRFFFDILAFMFMGMAFFKNGFLTGKFSNKYYLLLSLSCLAIGLTLSYFKIKGQLDANFDRLVYTKTVFMDLYAPSRTFRAIGIIAGIILMFKSGLFKWFFNLMRPVGQMAFTNYLMQSVLCGLFFYGIGFGMFGKLEIYQCYLVVFAVWAIEIGWSHLWLRYFRFGPMEWVWRSLTYWKWQPIKKLEVQKISSPNQELTHA
jgi:uncharacterized protein